VPLGLTETIERISAKVDALMTLCEHLKANLKNAQTSQLNLADSLVEKAVG
jgi:type I restriction enzyme S subunit